MPKTTKTKARSNIRKNQQQKETDQEIVARMGAGFLVSSITIIVLFTVLSLTGFIKIDISFSFVSIPGGIIGIFSAFAGPKIIHFFNEKWSNFLCVTVVSFGISILFIIGWVILASPNILK